MVKKRSKESKLILNPVAAGSSLAILSALYMLLLGITGNLGIYVSAVGMMQAWHMFFSLSPLGIIFGMLEAALISFISGWLFAVIYNKLA